MEDTRFWVLAAQVIVTAGLLVVAWRSLRWARVTFAQRERHEAARETPHTALMVQTFFWNPDQSPWFRFEDDLLRVVRWLNIFTGRGRDLGLLPLWKMCSVTLTCLGPGLVSSAEIPFSVEVFDELTLPTPEPSPTERFEGIFRIYHVPPGEVRSAVLAINVTFYPHFRITLGHPTIRDVAGREVEVGPDPQLSITSLEIYNFQEWNFLQQSRQAVSGPDPGSV